MLNYQRVIIGSSSFPVDIAMVSRSRGSTPEPAANPGGYGLVIGKLSPGKMSLTKSYFPGCHGEFKDLTFLMTNKHYPLYFNGFHDVFLLWMNKHHSFTQIHEGPGRTIADVFHQWYDGLIQVTRIYRFTSPYFSGWWYTYPSEKWWSSSVGMMIIANIWKVIKFHGSKPPISFVQLPKIDQQILWITMSQTSSCLQRSGTAMWKLNSLTWGNPRWPGNPRTIHGHWKSTAMFNFWRRSATPSYGI